MACPAESKLVRLFNADLEPRELAALERHVESCRQCLGTLKKLSADPDWEEQVRDWACSRKAIESVLARRGELQQRVSSTLSGRMEIH